MYMNNDFSSPVLSQNNGIQELSFDEIDSVNGGDAAGELAKTAAKAILRSPVKFLGGIGVGLTIAAVAVLVVAEVAEKL